MRHKRFLLLLVFILGVLVGSPVQSVQGPSDRVEGFWEGAVMFNPASVEVDIAVRFGSNGQGAWTGTIDIPILGVVGAPLQEVSVTGSAVAFTYRDAKRTRTFSGTLSGDVVRGKSIEGGAPSPFELRRAVQRAARRRPELHSLSPGGRELATLFNQDQQALRLIIIVAPTCDRCRMSTRVIQRYVLDQISDERLRVYLVWLARHKDDTQESAQQATTLMPDPRVTHFWTDNSSVSDLFKQPLGLADMTAWDVFLTFSPGLRWQELPPAPTSYMHMLTEKLPKDRQLDGQRLQEDLRAILDALGPQVKPTT